MEHTFLLPPCSLLHAAQPNIILIPADDLGLECIGAYRRKSYRKPNLDRFKDAQPANLGAPRVPGEKKRQNKI